MLKRTTLAALATVIALGCVSTIADAKPIFKPIFKPIKFGMIHHMHHNHYWGYRPWVRPIVVGSAVTAVSYPVVRAAVRTCLTKEYLPTGQVLFKDVCTNEWAMNPPPVAEVQAQPQVQAQ